ncbi:OLC1v1029289C1 [Oldenlandia corymbosa var. corymbosa]|uniref:OLC1v1029289C1 n=1 Tax=Oldenlandia corymbosa var. corymbosa TaxID=529605 RepID=A0AAV1CDN2_OLDCO|nr:OLC1v1029289C1 [Oldenlandia corymbosa var. corymbosa]
MSTVYVLEPPTKGKVILHTNYGPLDIELWPKEAPKAVRNFVQLCLEGYYDKTIFHRIIKREIVQGGDPTSTGTGGESIYGGVFPDEFHSRLRFKHRGLVACANAGAPNTNGSQFFMTLDRTDWLDKKHTIFGKVTGDSIYNLLRIGEVETDKDDRPVDHPPKVLSAEVLWNPFEDIVPRVSKVLQPSKTEASKIDVQTKTTKKLNLLSFGEEAEEEEKELATVKLKIRSSHDVLDDPRLLKDAKDTNDKDSSETKLLRDKQLKVREALSSKREELQGKPDTEIQETRDDSDEGEADFDAKMRRQILQKRKGLNILPPKQKQQKDSASPGKRSSTPPRSLVESDEERPKKDKLSLKKKGLGSEARAELMANADQDLQLLNNAERERALQKQKKRRRQGQEDEVLKRLENFKAAFSSKSNGVKVEKEGGIGVMPDWMKSPLKFAPEPGKDNMSRSNDPNDYVVHDPLLEKGKEKFNKMQAKQKRREREWAGKSLT